MHTHTYSHIKLIHKSNLKIIASAKARMLNVKTEARGSFQRPLIYYIIMNIVIVSTPLGSCSQILLQII